MSKIGYKMGDTQITLQQIEPGSANQLFGTNNAGTVNEYKTLNGTTNQVNVGNTSGTITLSLPQSIATSSTPTFNNLTLSSFSSVGIIHNASGGLLSSSLIVNADLSSGVFSSITGIGVQSQALNLNGNQINNVSNPTSAQDVATKNYVDISINGLDWKQACIVATTTGLPSYVYNNGSSGVGATITAVSTGTVVVDGRTLVLNDRILVKNETSTNAPYNGIYIVTQAGALGVLLILTRSTDYNQLSEINPGDAVFITSGTVNATTSWVQTSTITSVGGVGQNIIFSQASGPGAITINGTPNQIIASTTGTTTTLSTPQNINTNSTPTFASETLTATTNQLTLGTTNTTTISSTAPSASRTYTIPDAGTAANMVLDQGNYTIGGTWSFSNNVTLASSKTLILTDNSTHTVALKATNSTTSYTLSLPTTAGTSAYFLQTDGSGNTTWAQGGGVGYREDYVVGTPLNNYTGSTTVFNLVNPYTVGGHTLIVTYDGVTMTPGATVDYVETNSTTVTFNNALVSGQKVSFIFSQPATSPSGTVNSGTQYQLAYYAASSTTISGTSSITTDASGDLTVSGSTSTFGAGGIGSTNALVILNGGSATSTGAQLRFETNSVLRATVGNYGSIFGGSDNRLALYSPNDSIVFDVQGTDIATFTTSVPLSLTTGVSDGTTYTPVRMFSGASTNWITSQTTTSISTSFVTIMTTLIGGGGGGLMLVNGNDGSNYFMDLVLVGFSTASAPLVIASMTVVNSPAARTYQTSSTQTYQLKMASGTYSVNTVELFVGAR